jgi:ABC-type dipeptide/oligopeptide/nickel transport system ATPase component
MAAQLLIPAAWSVVLSAHERESLHGAAVDCNGRAIAILGFSGSGKTTAARRLIENGCSLISDDLLTFDDDLRVIPGPPWMRLDPCPGNEEESVLDAGGKMRIYPPVRSTPSPLSAMVIMAPEYTHFVRLSGTAAASALFQQVYNPVLTHSNQVERRFDLVLDLVDRVPVFGAAPRSLSADLLLRAGKESIA